MTESELDAKLAQFEKETPDERKKRMADEVVAIYDKLTDEGKAKFMKFIFMLERWEKETE